MNKIVGAYRGLSDTEMSGWRVKAKKDIVIFLSVGYSTGIYCLFIIFNKIICKSGGGSRKPNLLHACCTHLNRVLSALKGSCLCICTFPRFPGARLSPLHTIALAPSYLLFAPDLSFDVSFFGNPS